MIEDVAQRIAGKIEDLKKLLPDGKPIGKTFETTNKFYYYDTVTGKILECQKYEYELVEKILDGNLGELYSYSDKELFRYENAIDNLICAIKNEKIFALSKFSHMASFDNYEKIISEELAQVTIELTERCNLRCGYCIYNEACEKSRDFGERDMPLEVALRAIDYAEKNSRSSKELYIGFQMNDIYFRDRNNLFNTLLPKELRNKMPVGKKEVIEMLSFEQIIEYQKNAYKDFAICLSSKFHFFDEEIKSLDTMPEVKQYTKNKKSLYWAISTQASKKKSVNKSIYFESIKKYDDTKEYLINEFIKIYFFILFDNIFCEKIEQKGILSTEAIVYENIIVDEMCVAAYELEILKGIDEELMETMVIEVLRDIYSSTEITKSIFRVAKKEFFNIVRDTTFFEKCKQKFLHGVDMFLTFNEREICYELDYLDICNMAQMYLNYKSM